MLDETRRAQTWAVLGAMAVVAAVVTVAAFLERWRLALAATAILLLAIVMVLMDLRRRLGDVEDRMDADIERLDGASVHPNPAGEVSIGVDDPVVETITTRMSYLVANQTRDLEALLQLFARVEPQGPMPPSGGFALRPTGLLNICTLVQRHRPELVVELGSGTSTVWIGYALAANGCGRVISLEHSKAFADRTRAAVRLHEDASARIEVRHAPLTSVRLHDEEYRWYDPDRLADLQGIDLLIVDGPPGGTGPNARYPAVPLLVDRLRDGAVIVLDDADREGERTILDRWIHETSGLVRAPSIADEQAVLHYHSGDTPQ